MYFLRRIEENHQSEFNEAGIVFKYPPIMNDSLKLHQTLYINFISYTRTYQILYCFFPELLSIIQIALFSDLRIYLIPIRILCWILSLSRNLSTYLLFSCCLRLAAWTTNTTIQNVPQAFIPLTFILSITAFLNILIQNILKSSQFSTQKMFRS